MPITGLREAVIEHASAVAYAAAEALLADQLAAAPERTGALKDSARGPDLSWATDTVLRATIAFDVPYAEATDGGAVPHPIWPVRASALHFWWDDGPDGPGWYTFDHIEMHPGQQGTGWFSGPVERWEQYVQEASEQGGVGWAPPINSLAS